MINLIHIASIVLMALAGLGLLANLVAVKNNSPSLRIAGALNIPIMLSLVVFVALSEMFWPGSLPFHLAFALIPGVGVGLAELVGYVWYEWITKPSKRAKNQLLQ